MIVRAIGPSLAAGRCHFRARPIQSLQLIDSTGQILAANDDWMAGGQAQEIIETALAPSDAKGIRHHRLARARRLHRDSSTARTERQNIALWSRCFDLDAAHRRNC